MQSTATECSQMLSDALRYYQVQSHIPVLGERSEAGSRVCWLVAPAHTGCRRATRGGVGAVVPCTRLGTVHALTSVARLLPTDRPRIIVALDSHGEDNIKITA